MSIEQDYIIRLITALSRVLARIIFLKNQKDFPRAILEIQETGKILVGLDPLLVRRLSATDLMKLFGSDANVAIPKSYVLAILLKEEAHLRLLLGESDDAQALREKSLSLLLDTLVSSGEPIEERHTNLIDELLEDFKTVTLPVELLKKAFPYLEQKGRYDKAEDVLFEILESDAAYALEGIQFYRRLLAKGDEDLAAGNLPRNEVLEAVTELESKVVQSDGPRSGHPTS